MRAQSQIRRIREPSQLGGLVVRSILSFRTPPRISIDAADVPSMRVHAWEERLSQLQGACGCEQGGVGLLIGVTGFLLYLLLRPGAFAFETVDFWTGITVLFISSTAGKVIGLRIAQRELQKAVRAVRDQWAGEHRTVGVVPTSIGASSELGFRIARCCGGQPGSSDRQKTSISDASKWSNTFGWRARS
jgi:hypothetical protein